MRLRFPRRSAACSFRAVSAEVERSGSLAEFYGDNGLTARFDFSRDGVRRSLEASLQRLQLNAVDIAYVHDPDEHLEQAVHHTVPELCRLRAEGLVGAVGAGMNRSAALARLVRECDLDVAMIAGQYTLLDTDSQRELLPLCLQRGVPVVAAGVFNSGILAQRLPALGAPYGYRAADEPTLTRARRIAAICERHGTTLTAAAIAFPFSHPAVGSVVLGMRSAEEVRANVTAASQDIPTELWRDLELDRETAPKA